MYFSQSSSSPLFLTLRQVKRKALPRVSTRISILSNGRFDFKWLPTILTLRLVDSFFLINLFNLSEVSFTATLSSSDSYSDNPIILPIKFVASELISIIFSLSGLYPINNVINIINHCGSAKKVMSKGESNLRWVTSSLFRYLSSLKKPKSLRTDSEISLIYLKLLNIRSKYWKPPPFCRFSG